MKSYNSQGCGGGRIEDARIDSNASMKVDGKDRDWNNAPTSHRMEASTRSWKRQGTWGELCLANSLFRFSVLN